MQASTARSGRTILSGMWISGCCWLTVAAARGPVPSGCGPLPRAGPADPDQAAVEQEEGPTRGGVSYPGGAAEDPDQVARVVGVVLQQHVGVQAGLPLQAAQVVRRVAEVRRRERPGARGGLEGVPVPGRAV